MQMTQKLFETDSFLQTFTAVVLACEPAPGGFAVVLDRTAFFPEGGGQPCDTGTLGGARVTAVHTGGGVITHTVDAPLPVGQTVAGAIDWARRRDCMEQHTGEHILSGALHRLFGAENVGFHIGESAVRMDIDLPLSAAQLAEAEAEANAAVRADTPVRCYVPDGETLAGLDYRSKKALEGAVRIVEAGGDRCACCGTHLATTGQVGLIKILSAQH
ncbi:MAG: alanyl-tRNA editing protein, partial [Gemmiger sp.]